MTRVAYIGNFKHAHCTEVALTYGFQQNGCEVIEIQEDEHVKRRLGGLRDLDLILYTRTHNVHALHGDWAHVWRYYEEQGVQTAAFHLDRFWDLARERAIHDREPMFTMGTVFTADGGNDVRWAEAGVNHVWLPPAVDARCCYEGLGVRSPVRADVLFVGSTGYHHEYPERDQLVRYLKAKYGDRFLHVGHGARVTIREEHALADLINACKVVVGDSCFANSPRLGRDRSVNYWSDRIPETLGRAGLLIHAEVPGLRGYFTPGVDGHLLTHDPGDWSTLTTVIDYAIDTYAEEGRAAIGRRGMAHVQAHHTYTERAKTVLEVLGLRHEQPSLLDGAGQRLSRAVQSLVDIHGYSSVESALHSARPCGIVEP